MTSARWILALFAVLVVGAASVVLVNGYHERKASEAEQQSLELKGKVDALQEQARELVATADGHAKDAKTAAEEVRLLKAKLARAKQARPGEPSVHPVVPDGVPSDGDSPVLVDDLKDQIIDAQDRQITALSLEVDGLRSALVLKDQALVTQEQRVRGLEIALDAQRHAAKVGKWMGRIQGFAIGLGVGYVGGKL